MVEHEIIRDHVTKRPRGFGFVVFDSDHVVDNVLANGNRIDMAGTQVSYWQQSFMVLAIYYGRLMYKGIFEGFPLKYSQNCEIFVVYICHSFSHPSFIWISSLVDYWT